MYTAKYVLLENYCFVALVFCTCWCDELRHNLEVRAV